ncbi:MAG: tRNA (adenosine(37)-N6)-dimethylallyltransferase MiaA [Acidobacteria bacterium]|nr:tRNA (adenosine(37)-N6)-dimethylallyltransferase MiaA [Acidobacteriota bacterium]
MKFVIVITGPTATGKSRAALELARKLNGEIINADSMQVYRGMDIGTAKPGKAERLEIPHHLYDICDPSERFSAGTYLSQAEKVIRDILQRGRLPIVVGGTGLYTRALLTGFFEQPEMDSTVEDCFLVTLGRLGPEYLFRMLQKVDPEFSGGISPRDTQRVLRGLSFYFSTGKKLSSMWKNTRSPLHDLDFIVLGLTAERNRLYEAINRRVEQMMAAGFPDEVRGLMVRYPDRNFHAFKAIGYREMMMAVNGDISMEEAVERIKRNTRRFAKRQFTWFRGQTVQWFQTDPLAGKIPVAEIYNFINIKIRNGGEEL